jgi:BirA family biotin operon repressor/biotin-[acetyl-CoA-carboxylase] ligase
MGTAPASVEALRAALGPRGDEIDVAFVGETGSTNADLLEEVRTGGAVPRPRLLVAERQTAGRGRRGRRWHSTAGASLTFSLAWPMRRADLSGLSLAIGVAVAGAIDPAHRTERHVAIKWPNDLWLTGLAGTGDKLGGILIETTPVEGGRLAVIGIGLNVLEQRAAELSSGVAWLAQLDARASVGETLARIVPALMDALGHFDAAGFAPFAADFAARDLLIGRSVRCSGRGDGEGLVGVAAGVSPTGALRLRTARGIEHIDSGEVSVRMADDAAPAMPQTARAPC